MSFFRELKRRNVFRVAAAYLVGAWLLIEVSATLEETLHLPDWADSLLAMFLMLGFPVALFFSWAFEITPDGIKREKELEEDEASRKVTARKLDWAVIFMVTLAATYFVVDHWVLKGSDTISPAAEVAVEQAAGGREQPDPITSEAAEGEAASIPDLSIAVLPFVNMSSDPEQEYFSDGLTEELLNLLAGINELKVAARTSSFFYKDKLDTIPLTEVARQLEVAHVLEGSVRKGGDRIRITAQLIQADNGYHLWSETYDRTLDDVFAIQDEIAAAVVDQLKITLLGEAPHAKVIDTESWELTLQGRYLFGRRAEGDLEEALRLFERAVEIDPNNAAAWVGMSPLYRWLFDPPRVQDSYNAAQKAIELEPDNPEAWSRLAGPLYALGDPEGGEEAWQKAQELGQDNPLILSMMAGDLGSKGDIDGAVEYMQKAVALDPLYLVNRGNLASFLFTAGRLEEAEQQARKLMELSPSSDMGYHVLADIRLVQGRPEDALELVESVVKSNAKTGEMGRSLGVTAMAEYALGNIPKADKALQALETVSPPLWALATVYAWTGRKDQAFATLVEMLEGDPDPDQTYYYNPFYESLHDDPRWQRIARLWEGQGSVDE